MGNLFRLKKENEAIKDRIIKDIRDLFEKENESYYKSVRIGNFWSKKYIKYECNGDRNKTLLLREYLDKIRPNDLKKSSIIFFKVIYDIF